MSRSFFDENSLYYSDRQNIAWKDEEYNTLTQVLSISYIWPPLVTVVSTVVFGLLFSVVINMFKKPPKVKAIYMTPIILSFWKWFYGMEKLGQWVDFDEDGGEVGETDKTTVSSNSFVSGDVSQVIITRHH